MTTFKTNFYIIMPEEMVGWEESDYEIIWPFQTYYLVRCTQIKTYSWDNAQVILVGNKCDMEDERVISYERGKQLADSLGLQFFETSAKENINVRVRNK